ncbi:NigD1/NigD2 family lipoprotein [Saccharicrinis fermentans]|uniref:NigD-like protein n=1 Tax=Saccharicrinis fermentans DSM 9555 = JCM 21142 TaxID=869213 RepID=W7YIL6_9BACT|nr:NigD-like C-terminal domain-containing protein [Saccharicrinis fermentans]GAF04311.1 NigD-like protein [Saccharicrinis fermentans DSM 9555 = JCM 21142]
MKFLKMKHMLLMFAIVVGMSACSEDSDPIPEVFTRFGFMYTDGGNYFIDIDGGEKLMVESFDDEGVELDAYDRVLATFSIKETPEETILYDYLVELKGFYDIDFSDIVTLDDDSRDTIGDGFITVTDMGISENYLNLQIFYAQQKGSHVFSLCYDATQQEDGEAVILDLYNYYPEEEEDGGANYYTYQTYDLSELSSLLELNEDNEIEFRIRVNKGDSQEKIYQVVYDPS